MEQERWRISRSLHGRRFAVAAGLIAAATPMLLGLGWVGRSLVIMLDEPGWAWIRGGSDVPASPSFNRLTK